MHGWKRTLHRYVKPKYCEPILSYRGWFRPRTTKSIFPDNLPLGFRSCSPHRDVVPKPLLWLHLISSNIPPSPFFFEKKKQQNLEWIVRDHLQNCHYSTFTSPTPRRRNSILSENANKRNCVYSEWDLDFGFGTILESWPSLPFGIKNMYIRYTPDTPSAIERTKTWTTWICFLVVAPDIHPRGPI